jgi:hypothetical protein
MFKYTAMPGLCKKAFPKLQFLEKQPKIPPFCRAKSLKNGRSLSHRTEGSHHALEHIVYAFWDRLQDKELIHRIAVPQGEMCNFKIFVTIQPEYLKKQQNLAMHLEI